MINKKAEKIMLRILAMMLCVTFLCGFAAPAVARASNEDAELSDEGSDVISADAEVEEELLPAEPLVKSVGPVKAPPLKAAPSYMTMYLDIDSAIPGVQQFEYYLEYTGLDFNYNISTKTASTIPNSYGLIRKTLTIAAGSRIPISVEYYKNFYVRETPISNVHTWIQLGSDPMYEGYEATASNIWYSEGAVCFKHMNESSSGSITVKKAVTGNAPTGQTYRFSVVRHNGTYKWVEEIVTLSAGQTSATIPYTHTTEYGATTQIWIAELDTPAGATASYTVNGSPASAQTRGLHERFLQDVCNYDNSKLQRYQNLKWVLLDTDSNCPDIAVVCTNAFPEAPKTAEVTVSKTVTGSLSDLTKKFDFTVSYTDKDGKSQTDTFKLKNGESRKFTVQAGSNVTVTESGADEYKTSYTVGSGSSINGKTCTLKKVSGNTAVNFKNTYEPTSTSVTLGGTKTFTGFPTDSSVEPVFTFTLSENGKVIDTKTVTKQGAYAFNEITYTLPGEHTYTIVETKGDEGGVTYDTKTYTVKVKVTDNKASALVATISGDTTSGTDLDFTNSYSAKPVSVQFGGLKILEGRELANEEFSFTLTGSGNKNETVKNAADGKIAFLPITYTVPGIYTYTVREESTAESGVTIDSTVYNITVTVTDDGSGQLKAAITDSTGAVITGKALNFTNSYSAKSVSVQFGGLKTLKGRELANEEFSFTLRGYGVEETVKNAADGKITFEPITYTRPGTYTYTVREDATTESGVTIDSTVYNITVTVTDDGSGQLKAAITDSTGAVITGKALNFTNSYSAKSVSVQFGGLKTLKGRELANEEFSFTLTGSGNKNETVKNAADGKIAFLPITYTEPGTYTYTVREESTTESGVTIDSTVYNITVTVTDDGNGQLKAAITDSTGAVITGTDLNFNNVFSYGSLKISKEVTGDLGNKNKEFTFKVEFDSDGYFSYTGSKSGTLTSGDTVKLKHGESIVISGIPAGTKYKVTESDASGYSVYSTGDSGEIATNSTVTAAFTNTKSSIPKTGDSTDLNTWLGLTAACMGGLLFMAASNKKKHGKHEV